MSSPAHACLATPRVAESVRDAPLNGPAPDPRLAMR
jgi:hypothetical protein